jgi:pimeloyl-ACP methyl ester carboxylesterase
MWFGSGPGLSKLVQIAGALLIGGLATSCMAEGGPAHATAPLIVVGFMGGRVSAGNVVHREARVATDLERRYPETVKAIMFANRNEPEAMRAVLKLLGNAPKSAARIVLFGHSWGASETVHFARELNARGIPVLLTVQVDSVEKIGEDDADIPPNVRQAVNFFQTAGWLHGRRVIRAENPRKTDVLGNFESSYAAHPVSVAGYSWYSRMFMRPHIEIENDDALWTRIEGMIAAKVPVGDALAQQARVAALPAE